MPANDTHDPSLKSWVESANDPGTEFPIQNLPLVAFEAEHDDGHGHRHSHPHLGVLIGDQVLDVSGLNESNYFADESADLAAALEQPFWNAVAGEPHLWPVLRRRLQHFLRADTGGGQQVRRLRQKCLRPARETELIHPVSVFNYTDFYASKHHATNVGSMFRPDNPLLPNYVHVPIGYHGRASSVVVSGSEVRRPRGQTKADDAAAPMFGPCKMLDYEMELAAVVGAGSRLGDPVEMADVHDHLFGMVILNDWSARDIQKWEYQPLGPFLAKNFATTISPAIVTMEALEPFRVAGPAREAGDPQPLEYLRSAEPWGLDVTVEVWVSTAKMRAEGRGEARISRGSFREMYWTVAQMLVHHTSNGCNVMPGDLLGSGTISGRERESRGCLLELTWDGHDPAAGKPKPRKPVELPGGETRTFLQDGDEVVMRAFCEREGYRKIGFGECRGRVVG
jgi:fumarylacetoacetase